MPTYKITLSRRVRQPTDVVLQAPTMAEAVEQARAWAARGDLDWYEGTEEEITVTGSEEAQAAPALRSEDCSVSFEPEG